MYLTSKHLIPDVNLFCRWYIYTPKIQNNKKQYSSLQSFAIVFHLLNVNLKLDVVENAYNLSTQEVAVGDLEFETSWTQNQQNLTGTHGTLPTLILDDDIQASLHWLYSCLMHRLNVCKNIECHQALKFLLVWQKWQLLIPSVVFTVHSEKLTLGLLQFPSASALHFCQRKQMRCVWASWDYGNPLCYGIETNYIAAATGGLQTLFSI